MRKTDKRQNPTASQIRLHPRRRLTKPKTAMHTALDTNRHIRQLLIKRITDAISKPTTPVAVLHQVAQCIELWSE